MKRILNKIKEHNTIIIHGHKRPDGDCYGAQFGLKDIITTTYPSKEVYVVGQQTDYLAFVGSVDEVSDDKFKGALSIVVDTATEDRISDSRHTLSDYVIKIDHHIPVDNYGDLRWVDTNFPSCSQMIAYFAYKFRSELTYTLKGANAMYTGIVTDTGRFRFRGVSNLTHQLAGMLIEKGVDVEYIDQNLGRETLNMIKFKGHIYNAFKISPKGFVYATVTNEDIKKFNINYEQAASMVSLLGGIEEYRVWALFLEQEGNEEIRVRLRSNGPDIDKVANKYRGGGHKKAAGATLNSINELDNFIKDVEVVLDEYKNEL